MNHKQVLSDILAAAKRFDPERETLAAAAAAYLRDLRQRGPTKQFQFQIGRMRFLQHKRRGKVLLFSVFWVYDHPMFGLIGEEVPDWRVRRGTDGRLILSPPCSVMGGKIRFHAIPTRALREWIVRTLEQNVPDIVEKVKALPSQIEYVEEHGAPPRVLWSEEGSELSQEGMDHLWER